MVHMHCDLWSSCSRDHIHNTVDAAHYNGMSAAGPEDVLGCGEHLCPRVLLSHAQVRKQRWHMNRLACGT
jgi:hypothetical protein